MEMQSRKSYLPTTAPESARSSADSPSKSSKRFLHRSSASPIWLKVRNLLLGVVALANLALSIWVVIEHGNLPEMFPGDHGFSSRVMEAKQCYLPQLSPSTPEIKALLQEPTRIDCPTAANADFPGRIFFRTDRRQNLIRVAHPGIPCCYRPFFRVNDDEVWIEPTKDRRYVCHNITEAITPIPPNHEFIEVICDDNHRTYRDAFAFVPRKEQVDARVKGIVEEERLSDPLGPPTKRLSVIVLGLDSTSQQNFVRKMPKSLDFLQNHLHAIRLDGYGKVGEDTLASLVPLLAGISLDELKERCVAKNPPMEAAVHLDSCPFIWTHFLAKGYVTSFAEDEVSAAIFNRRWSHAFLTQPTDHYLRPFSLRVTNAHNIYDGFCQGPRMSVQVLLDHLEKTATTYTKDDLLLQLTWATKLTQDLTRLGWADGHLLNTLRFLKTNGNLNHTALLLLSDHGSRRKELRGTRQGQLEDRLPLAWIALPPWFSAKYPSAVANLENNAKVVTSAYDMHETLKDLADLAPLNDHHSHYVRQRKLKVAEKKGLRRGTSLFTRLPEHRNCASAGIPAHWCICYKKTRISIKSLDVHDALAFILRNLNGRLRSHSHLCATHRVHKVINAVKWHPEETVEDTFSGNPEESYKKASLLQIRFTTTTAREHPEFEVTVVFEPDHGWGFTEQVERLDAYEDHSRCVSNHELKKLCMCTQQEPPHQDPLTGHEFPVF